MMIAAEGNHNTEELQRSSNISIIESESYTPRHSYNTRLAARLSQTGLRKASPSQTSPYVDLSTSRVEILSSSRDSDITEDLDYLPLTPYRRLDVKPTFFEKLKRFLGMDWDCYCDRYNSRSSSNNRDSKTCLAVGIIVIIIIALVPTHHIVKTITKDIDQVRSGVNGIKEDTASKLAHMEKVLQDIDSKLKDNRTDEAPLDACEQLKNIIRGELEKMGSKKTLRPDFALESAGGRIVKIVDTENLEASKSGLFGKCDSPHGPEAMIRPGNAPGQCWAFKGNKGTAVIKLLARVRVEAVTLEHIAKTESPSGSVSSAPKDFMVKGVNDCDGRSETLLGQFSYDVNGPAIQTFEIPKPHYPFEFVEFSVLSNHGNADFTCVYRLRVHGTLETPMP